jgi:hypothetical protein
MATRPTLAAFDKGEVPTIACFNQATVDLGVDFDKLIAALQAYVDRHVAPVWGTPAKLIKTKDFVKNAWAIVFLNDADAPGALAYHELTPDGFPLSKVFVKTTLASGNRVSVSASHELVEMLVDPAINLMSTGPQAGTMYAYESADTVEALTFNVKGIPMSDFVYPSYFEVFRKRGSTRFDHMGRVKKPFEILAGGYQIIFRDGEWTEIFASSATAKRFALDDRRGHRSESRGKRMRRTSSGEIERRNGRKAGRRAA